MRLYQANGYLISIPAPAREATCLAPYAVTLEVISIPAPARGATFQSTGSPIAFLFQFPPLREGRHASSPRMTIDESISIPAPARGATRRAGHWKRFDSYFNSRPCARGDAGTQCPRHHLFYFNSRPCARGDPVGAILFTMLPNFNSRPCARGD